MKRQPNEHLPDDLLEVVQQLRAGRPEVTALELDHIKQRAMAQASRGVSRLGRGSFMRSRIVTLLLVFGLAVSGGTAGVIASGGGSSHKSAASSQYCPPASPASSSKPVHQPVIGCGHNGGR